MSIGDPVVYSAVIASGASTSSSIRLYNHWKNLNVRVGTMSTGVQIQIQHSTDDSTWYQLFHPTIQSATVATPTFIVAAGVGTNGGMFPMAYHGFSYMRFVLTGVVSGGCSFNVVASGN